MAQARFSFVDDNHGLIREKVEHSVMGKFVLMVVAVTILSGCVVAIGNKDAQFENESWAEIERDNRAALHSLNIGMSIDAARSIMPTEPAFSEAFMLNGAAYRVLFYRTMRVKADGLTTRDETTPLIFVDEQLTGWGESAWYELTGRSLAQADLTP
ncbi:MAG: DUF3192 domain-containing protein [Xanthomonadaceae bacterium]|nr:DUF3192 domain-containing protein [Xanthomonadaceae bacterium]